MPPERVGSYEGNELHLLHLDRLADWPASLDLRSPHFSLLVAGDLLSPDGATLEKAARSALAQGMVAICAWGPGCQRIEDQVDHESVADGLRKAVPRTEHTVILTSSFAGDRLDEALFFFLACRPAEAYRETCRSWLAVSVGGRGTWDSMKARLSDVPRFFSQYCEEEDKAGPIV